MDYEFDAMRFAPAKLQTLGPIALSHLDLTHVI